MVSSRSLLTRDLSAGDPAPKASTERVSLGPRILWIGFAMGFAMASWLNFSQHRILWLGQWFRTSVPAVKRQPARARATSRAAQELAQPFLKAETHQKALRQNP